MTLPRMLYFALAGCLSVSAQPAAAEQVIASDRLEPCLKSINLIGASMGHVEKISAGGKSMLHFLIRSNGAEYEVACETDTGFVKDVTAHVANQADIN